MRGRALARKVGATDDLMELAKKNGVNLIPADVPSLFTNDQPVDTLVRRILTAIWEFERDMIYKHLMASLVEKLH